MQYVSCGSFFLEKKVNIARRRMFLFAGTEQCPTSQSTYGELMALIHKSRSFCALLDAQNKMQCVRASGWRSGKFWFNYVPSIGASINGSSSWTTYTSLTAFDVFCKYYAVGRTSSGSQSAFTSSLSLLENLRIDSPYVPCSRDMILPPFTGEDLTTMRSDPSSSVSIGDSDGGTITNGAGGGLGQWTRDTTQYIQAITVSELSTSKNTSVIASTNRSYNSTVSPSTGFAYPMSSSIYPRLFTAYYEQRYGERYYSGGGWKYTTTTYNGPIRSSIVAGYDRAYYTTGGAANTPMYTLDWGMMPIATKPDEPILAVIVRRDEDFVQEGSFSPGTLPDLTMNAFEDVVYEKVITL